MFPRTRTTLYIDDNTICGADALEPFESLVLGCRRSAKPAAGRRRKRGCPAGTKSRRPTETKGPVTFAGASPDLAMSRCPPASRRSCRRTEGKRCRKGSMSGRPMSQVRKRCSSERCRTANSRRTAKLGGKGSSHGGPCPTTARARSGVKTAYPASTCTCATSTAADDVATMCRKAAAKDAAGAGAHVPVRLERRVEDLLDRITAVDERRWASSGQVPPRRVRVEETGGNEL